MKDAALLAQWRATERVRKTPLRDFVRERIGYRWKPARHLERVYQLFERAEREPVFACVSMPPGHAKSETALACMAWMLCRRPTALHAYVSYNGPATRSKSLTMRAHAAAGGVLPDPDFWSWSEWRTSVGGGLVATGIGGRLTGDRATGVVLIDDPFKNLMEADSAARRELVSAWFDSVAYTRRYPGASVIVMHTRWNRDDLIGRLLQVRDGDGRPTWEEVRLPAIDERGEALWPEVFPREELDRIRRQLDASNPHLWPALYQQQPVPRGGRLFREPARYLATDLPRDLRRMIGTDFAASTKRRADSTAAMVLGLLGHGPTQRAYELDLGLWKLEGPDALARVRAVQTNHGGAPLAWETNGVGRPLLQQFRRLYPQAHVLEVSRANDKYTEATGAAAAWNDGRLLVPLAAPWAEAHMARARAFTGLDGGEDDDLDAMINGWNAGAGGGAASGRVSL